MALLVCQLVILMEYTLKEYKRTVGKVFITSDGNKYILSKSNVSFVYLGVHYSEVAAKERANSIVKENERKCKTVARKSQTNLRKVFDDVTRDDPRACEISLSECESTMFRVGKTV